MSRILTMVACLGLVGCSVASRVVPVATMTGPYKLQVYKQGTPAPDVALAPGSEEEREVARWLAAHESGWESDISTYAPSRRIAGENFNLDIHANQCVLNYAGPGGWTQVSRPIEADDIPGFLKERP